MLFEVESRIRSPGTQPLCRRGDPLVRRGRGRSLGPALDEACDTGAGRFEGQVICEALGRPDARSHRFSHSPADRIVTGRGFCAVAALSR